jgi:ATP adenylyltransferase
MNMTALPTRHQGGCRFCSLLSGAAGDSFDSVWLGSVDYRALLSVGALVPGWTLICPVRHVVNLCQDYGRSDFWSFSGSAAAILEERYGSPAYFEHGSASEASLTGCGVGHAHGHLVPLTFDLEREALHSAAGLRWQSCDASDINVLAAGREYLFVAACFEGVSTRGSICVLDEPTSQFFRRVIAKKLGMSDLYDYNKYPMLDIAAESARELRGHAAKLVKA